MVRSSGLTSQVQLRSLQKLLTLKADLYQLHTQSLQPGSTPSLFIAPVLFKTVSPQTHSEQVLWKMRQSVLSLKLYDLIAHQFADYCSIRGLPFAQEWSAAPSKLVQDFCVVCRDIIPRHLLPAEIVEFFGSKEVEAEMRRKERRDLKRWGNLQQSTDPARGRPG